MIRLIATIERSYNSVRGSNKKFTVTIKRGDAGPEVDWP